MADRVASINHVLKVEGGYVDDPADPGGATKYGITQKTWDVFNVQRGADTSHVRWISKCDAREVYESMYWEPLNLEQVHSDRIALCIFDQAVNQGLIRATKRAQEVVNFLTRGVNLKVDGLLGPKTIKGLNMTSKSNFVPYYLQESRLYYVDLMAANPVLIKFRRGWLNRVFHLELEARQMKT